MRYILLLILSLVSLHAKHDKLFPKYDKRCDAMKVQHAQVDPLNNLEHVDYFAKDVPKIIHQIWFGPEHNLDKTKTKDWEKYAKEFGYEYVMWGESNLRDLQAIMDPGNYSYFLVMLNSRNFTAASDIARYEILNKYGGIYIDCDFSPPKKKKVYVNLENIFSMKGLTLVTEHQSRNIGESALFVCNGILVSSPNHPVIASAVDQIEGNIASWCRKYKNYDAMFCTGPFFLNKVLWGTFNVVPITYLQSFGMD